MEVALKTAGSGLDSLQLTFLRFMIGGLILLPFGIGEARQRGTKISVSDMGWLLAVGIMGIPVSMLCFQLGVERCNAATASSLICLNPLFTMVIAHIFTSEKMNKAKGISFVIGVVAAVFMIRPWNLQTGNTVPGIALMLAASITFAAYTVMGKRSVGRLGTFTQTSISFILGSLILLAVILFTGRPVLGGVLQNWIVVAYVGIFVTGLGYMFYFLAIRHSDATTGSIAFFIKPAIAPVLAVLLLHESVYWNTIVGVALLIFASLITLRDTWAANTIDDTEEPYEHEIDEIFAKRKPKVMGKRRYFGAFIPLVQVDGEDCLVFEVREKGEIFQPGELCFPGGEITGSETPEMCAVRETMEELGIDRSNMHVINQMDTFHGYTGLTIYCFIGRLDVTDFKLKRDEVRDTMIIPVDFFVNTVPEVHQIEIVQKPGENFPNEKIEAKDGYNWRKGKKDVPIYNYEGHSVWGLTAMIVQDFSKILIAGRKAQEKKKKRS
jgi:drug/metabolite transporter (DMT)-like permease/8-oxo-dGTP pyrophosphatase MutT (NUDIX family)